MTKEIKLGGNAVDDLKQYFGAFYNIVIENLNRQQLTSIRLAKNCFYLVTGMFYQRLENYQKKRLPSD
jgi:hypothetical protein